MNTDFCITLPEQYVSCHAPSICELPSGDLLACCFAGTQELEGAPDQVTLGARLDRRSDTWSEPEVWVDVPHRASGNPRVFVGPKQDEVWLVAPVSYGKWCGGSTRLFLKRSYDEGRSWKDLELLVEEKGILGKNKPLIRDNLCILPVEQEHTWNPKFLRSEDYGASWELVGNLGEEAGVRIIQPTVVELNDGTFLAYMRSQENYIFEARSSDRGRTWSRPKATELPNNNSGIDMVRLSSGNLVLVFNPTRLVTDQRYRDGGLPEHMAGFTKWGPRTPLVAALSEDEGKSWPNRLVLEDGPGVYCYPAVIQGSDGSIHIAYTYERKAIRHVKLYEKELLNGGGRSYGDSRWPVRD
ncbi:MAG TPA: sialidase family protein [Spirochaetia bacterium]|nr:sialidase family protein [Spirochaetia bacterium]